jgi:hypothetical protein
VVYPYVSAPLECCPPLKFCPFFFAFLIPHFKCSTYMCRYFFLSAHFPQFGLALSVSEYRALSAHSAAECNSSPGRWQHVWLVAIVPPERWGKMDRNDCHTAWGSFKTLISLLHHSKNYACSFSLIDFLFIFNVVF